MRPALLAALLAAAAPARAWNPFPEPSDGKIRPVQALHDAGRPEQVLAALTPQFLQTLRGTDLRQAYVLLGDDHARLGRLDEALGDYQLGVSLFPKNVDLLVRLAMLLHRGGLDDQAGPLFERALRREPRHWNAHQGLAEIDRRLGLLDRAAAHYEVTLESVDGRADIWRDYAETLLAMRDFKTADLALRKSLSLDPRSPDARVLLAFARRAQGDFDGAVADLDEALSLGAGIGARRAKALFLLEAGRLDAAARAATAVLGASPGDGAALWTLARARLALGDRSGALRWLAEIRAEDGRNAFAAQAARALSEELGR